MDRTRWIVSSILGVSLAVVAWWLVGDLSSPGFSREELDFTLKAPESFERNATEAGIVGGGVAMVCLSALVWIYLRDRPARFPLWSIAAIAVVGLYAGFAARVVTAGGIGANIGGGLIVMLTIAGSVAGIFTLRRRNPSSDSTSSPG